MSDELLFTVSEAAASRAQPVTLAEAGLTERGDLQEWVLANPDILGDGVRILTLEFDAWVSGGGSRERDRLDILGLDRAGSLVVAELKRDRAASSVDTQAIRYAALASRFTPATLAAAHARFLTARGQPATPDAALVQIEEHAGGELAVELLRRPRIVLVASAFPPTVSASAVWLTEMGLDITLVQYRAYRAGRETVLSVSTLWPIADVEDFTLTPQEVDARTAARRRDERRRMGSAVQRLVNAGALESGTPLFLRATTEVDAEARDQIDAWVAGDPRRGQAMWHNDPSGPLEWRLDGQCYTPTALARKVIAEGAGLDRSPRGTSWWVTEEGDDLVALADVVAPDSTSPAGGYQPFDWSELHAALDELKAGEWTTYGDLARLIGTSAIAVGQHVAACEQCPSAYRVLSSSGKPAEGFRWTDPDETRAPLEVLASEGVHFVEGRAHEDQRVRTADLQQRYVLSPQPRRSEG